MLIAPTLTVTTDVQRDDQESGGLQAEPQRLHGRGAAGARGTALRAPQLAH